MSLQRCQFETTSSEFVEWIVWLDEQDEKDTREHYYMAQVAMEIRKGNVKHPNRVKLKHLLLKFEMKGASSKDGKDENGLTPEERMKRSKSFWFSLVGIKDKEVA